MDKEDELLGLLCHRRCRLGQKSSDHARSHGTYLYLGSLSLDWVVVTAEHTAMSM